MFQTNFQSSFSLKIRPRHTIKSNHGIFHNFRLLYKRFSLEQFSKYLAFLTLNFQVTCVAWGWRKVTEETLKIHVRNASKPPDQVIHGLCVNGKAITILSQNLINILRA